MISKFLKRLMCYTSIFISISEYSNSEAMVHIGFFEFFLGVMVFFMTKDCREYFKVSIHWMIGIIITNVVYFYLFYKNVSDDSETLAVAQFVFFIAVGVAIVQYLFGYFLKWLKQRKTAQKGM